MYGYYPSFSVETIEDNAPVKPSRKRAGVDEKYKSSRGASTDSSPLIAALFNKTEWIRDLVTIFFYTRWSFKGYMYTEYAPKNEAVWHCFAVWCGMIKKVKTSKPFDSWYESEVCELTSATENFCKDVGCFHSIELLSDLLMEAGDVMFVGVKRANDFSFPGKIIRAEFTKLAMIESLTSHCFGTADVGEVPEIEEFLVFLTIIMSINMSKISASYVDRHYVAKAFAIHMVSGCFISGPAQ